MATHLTSRGCASAKPKIGRDGKPTQTAFPDDDPTGLELRVSAEGRKTWSFRYRTEDGRQRRITLGVFVDGEDEPTEADRKAVGASAEALTLKAARRRARAVRAEAEEGRDPVAAKKARKAAEKARTLRTFDELADAYLDACERGEWRPRSKRKRARTLADERNILRRSVRPVIGALVVEDVTRAKVRQLLRNMAARGIGAQVNRTHAVVRQVFAWAIAEERVTANPATGFKPLATETARARVVTDAELKALWTAIRAPEDYEIPQEGADPRPLYLSRPVAIVLQLCALLLQRRAEITGMRRAELNLAEKTWLIPAERTKSGRPHLVPLPPRAVDLIEEALKLADLGREKPAECVFPGRRDGAKPMRPDSITHALADVARACGVEGVTVHDLRRTGASAMASERLSVSPFIISRVLGHNADTGGAAAVTMRHYALYDFAREKRIALEGWEALLLEIVGERARPDNLRRLNEARA